MSVGGDEGGTEQGLGGARSAKGGWTDPGNFPALLAGGVGLVASVVALPLIGVATFLWDAIEQTLEYGDSLPWWAYLTAAVATLATLVMLCLWLACVTYLAFTRYQGATRNGVPLLACGGIGGVLVLSALVAAFGFV